MAVKAQKTYTVSVAPRSSGSEFHAAIADLSEPHDLVRLMAGSMAFVTPRETCGLRALIEYAARQSEEVVLDCPTDRDVHVYLERIDFYKDLPSNVALSHPRPEVRRKDRRADLIEVTRIASEEDVGTLMERVSTVAKPQLGSGPVANAFTTAVTEATENVVSHADSPIGAVVAAQRYDRTGLELSVIDLGAGIPATLARNPAHRGLADLAAIERALEDGVSSINEPGRGAGLWRLAEAVCRGRNATLVIGSGNGELGLAWENGRRRRYAAVPAIGIRGTWIWIRIAA